MKVKYMIKITTSIPYKNNIGISIQDIKIDADHEQILRHRHHHQLYLLTYINNPSHLSPNYLQPSRLPPVENAVSVK
jgi:hypothetical protein